MWWDSERDVVVLDMWAIFADVEDPVSYLGLKPFFYEEYGAICITTLEIVSEERQFSSAPRGTTNIIAAIAR